MGHEEVGRKLKQYSDIYLYGAGVVAYGAYKAIEGLFNITVKGFLVTDKGGGLEEIEGIPICEWKEVKVEDNDLIVIATPEEYHNSIIQTLHERGIVNYIKLDSHMEYILMGQYLKKVCGLKLIEDCMESGGINSGNNDNSSNNDIVRTPSVVIYMAVSHKDRKLNTVYKEADWIKKIQVGAVLTSERIAGITDEQCGSISEQNLLYGELSASYYAWKYGIYKVTGLFHYRRILKVSEKQLKLLISGKLDALLPLPFVCYPDASGQYGRYLSASDIEVMTQVLEEKETADFGIYKELLKIPYLYNYNMLIARKEVFDDYCSWIFPLLGEITYRCEMTKTRRLPRYIGRIGEILTSLYFMKNTKQWKIAHAEKVWRV